MFYALKEHYSAKKGKLQDALGLKLRTAIPLQNTVCLSFSVVDPDPDPDPHP
jgi:hypothetical protein